MNFVSRFFFGLTQLFELFKSHKNWLASDTPKCTQTPSLYRHAGPACSIQTRDCKDNVLEVTTRPRFRGLAPVWAKIQEKPPLNVNWPPLSRFRLGFWFSTSNTHYFWELGPCLAYVCPCQGSTTVLWYLMFHNKGSDKATVTPKLFDSCHSGLN